VVAVSPLTKFTIQPFSEYDLTNDPEEKSKRCHFNRDLSHICVRVEHAFGILKGRFMALRGLRGRDLAQMWGFIEAPLVIHNILTEYGDDPYEIEGFNGQEDEDNLQPDVADDDWVCGTRGQTYMNATRLYETRVEHRKQLMNLINSDI
jgi:hypothetical protein